MKITRTTPTQKTKGNGFNVHVLESLLEDGFDQRGFYATAAKIAPECGVPGRTKTEALLDEASREVPIVDQTDSLERLYRTVHDGLVESSTLQLGDDLRPGIGTASQELERRFFSLFDVGVEVEQARSRVCAFDQFGSAARRSAATVSDDSASLSPLSSSSSVGNPIAIRTSFSIFLARLVCSAR